MIREVRFTSRIGHCRAVGYLSFQTSANINDLHGAPFINVGEEDLDIQDIKLSDGSNAQDILMVFNAANSTYENFNWFANAYDPDTRQPVGPGWGAQYMIKAGKIGRGQGFWLKTIKANTVTVSGQVVAAEDNSFETEANVNDIVACIYPVELDIQDITLSDGSNAQDILMVFNPETNSYENYNWFANAYDPDTRQPVGPGWGSQYMVKKCTIKPGQGFWLKTIKKNTVSFKSPL